MFLDVGVEIYKIVRKSSKDIQEVIDIKWGVLIYTRRGLGV